MSHQLLRHILRKHAQLMEDELDPGYTHSHLLPPVPDAAAPLPAPARPVPVAPIAPIAPGTPTPVKKYIPPPRAGQQTAAQRAAWTAAIDAQGGQGDAGAPTPVPGFGPKPKP